MPCHYFIVDVRLNNLLADLSNIVVLFLNKLLIALYSLYHRCHSTVSSVPAWGLAHWCRGAYKSVVPSGSLGTLNA